MASNFNKLKKEIELRMGGGMIDVELDPEHYNLAIDKELSKYRQRSSRSTEESFVAITLKEAILILSKIELSEFMRYKYKNITKIENNKK